MTVERERIPPGPEEEYRPTDDLLGWMNQQFARFGNIYKAFAYGTNVYVIREPKFAYHVLVENWQNYVKGQFIKRVTFLLGNGLMVSEGELWKRQRRMIQPAFDHKLISAMARTMVMVNSALLVKWQIAAQRNESVNVTRDVSSMALEVILRFILGDDYERIGFHFNLLTEQATRDLAFAQTFRKLGQIILQVTARRRSESAKSADVLGILMQARDPGSGQMMQDRQLINEILTLIVAGHETTASTLNWTWYLISQHPEVEERLSNEVRSMKTFREFEDLPKFPYARQTIEESMRMYPAGWLMTRRAVRNDRLGGYFVPAGTEIYVSPYFIQRHPDLWANPDTFNPDRFGAPDSRYRQRLTMIPFSSGPRNCIGALFGRVEMQIHLLMIARHLRLRYVQSRPIELDAGVNLRSKYDFIMHPEFKTAVTRSCSTLTST
jgi:cytochrome P450